jgi:DNA repair exonuclease SbcCD nuclease subunit
MASAATRRNVDSFAELLRDISDPLTELKRAQIPLIAIPGNHEYGRGREGGETCCSRAPWLCPSLAWY